MNEQLRRKYLIEYASLFNKRQELDKLLQQLEERMFAPAAGGRTLPAAMQNGKGNYSHQSPKADQIRKLALSKTGEFRKAEIIKATGCSDSFAHHVLYGLVKNKQIAIVKRGTFRRV